MLTRIPKSHDNGFKQHIAAEVETDLIVACTVTPANRPEVEDTPALQKDMRRQGIGVGELYIDRGYIPPHAREEPEEGWR